MWERTLRLVDSEPFWTITRGVAHALLAVETLTRRAVQKVIRTALEPRVEPEFTNYILEPPNGRRD
jgi:hypothetical protein